MKYFGFISLVIFLFVFHAAGQTPTPTPQNSDDGDIVKISTNLIQVDVNVLDKKGNQVTGLKPEDFEIRENGKVQKITNFSYVAVSRETKAEAAKSAAETKSNSRVPPVAFALRPEQVRRTIVLLVDDLGLSFSSMYWVREALKKFVDEQMQPDDLVAIMRTGSGVGALQQFTSDKRLLRAAISKVKWSFTSRHGMSVFEPVRPTTKDLINGVVDSDGNAKNAIGNDRDKENEKNAEEFRSETYTVGTLGSIRHIIGGLNKLPGRKSIIMLSDGIIMNRDMFEQMRRLVEQANRAGVVISTIDAKGVADAGFMGPENDTRGLTFEQIDRLENDRRSESSKMQEGLSFLAYETGGRPVKNNNDLNQAIDTVLRAEEGYYLIGYEPDDETFDPKTHKFNRMDVKVSRPDTVVRYRSGFFGYTDTDAKKNQTSDQEINTALISPFASKDIETRLTSIFGVDPKIGEYSRALLHIDVSGIEFTDEPGGNKKISLDIYAYVFGPTGNPVGYTSKNYTFAVRESSMPRLLEKGITFPMNVPISKPGPYQLRMAVRDTKSGKIGSASQFIEIPDISKERLTLSGIIVQNLTPAELKARAGAVQKDANAQALTDTATRMFKRGSLLIYNYAIYNAKTAPGQGVKLQTYIRLFRDGQLVYESEPVAVNAAGQADLAHIEDRGVMTLGSNLAPGDYVLQLVTTDGLAKEKNQIAAQTIDFEVIE